MSKAYEVMTKSLAICHPEDNAVKAAKIMKDRDIGDVLVVEDGKLLGIVTDRDLAVNALSDTNDIQSTPISRYMNTNIITGAAEWGLNKVAKTMAKHQIRRLPITDHGNVVGIISLGDLARHYGRKDTISDSLKNISKPNNISSALSNGGYGKWLGLSLLALSAGAAYWLTMSHTGQQFRNQMMDNKYYKSATRAVNDAGSKVLGKVNEAASSKQARNLRKNLRSNLRDFSSQLPSIQYKAARSKRMWFR